MLNDILRILKNLMEKIIFFLSFYTECYVIMSLRTTPVVDDKKKYKVPFEMIHQCTIPWAHKKYSLFYFFSSILFFKSTRKKNHTFFIVQLQHLWWCILSPSFRHRKKISSFSFSGQANDYRSIQQCMIDW